MVFVKSGYLLDGHIPTEQDVNFGRKIVRERMDFKRRLLRVLATSSFGSSGLRKNILIPVSGAVQEERGLRETRLLLLFRIKVAGDCEDKYCFCST